MSVNNLKAKSLRALGYTGSIDDMYRSYLQDITGSSLNSIDDLENHLFGGSGNINDRWKTHLGTVGIRGRALDNMLREYWSTVGGGALATSYLFRNNEVGVWYDPSDFSTVYQDSTGTTPVTAVGQPVGLMLDKSGNGYHASQATSTARPILGRHPITGRRNLLTYTEDFSNAAWTKSAATITAGINAPDGSMTAYHLIENAAVTRGRVSQFGINVGEIISVYAKAAEWGRLCLGISNGSGEWSVCNFNLTAGSIDRVVSYSTALVDTPVITSIGNGWYRCSIRVVSTATAARFVELMPFNQDGDPINPSPPLVGDGTSGIYVWHPQAEISSITAYQKVVSTYDVTEAGVNDAYYLKFDGVDDFMVTPSIDFSATDKMSVFAGVLVAKQLVSEIICDFGAGGNTIATGATLYALFQDPNMNFVTGITSAGPLYSQASFGTDSANGKKTLVANMDFAGTGVSNELSMRVNATTAPINVPALNDANPAGNFGNYPMYIGMRAGTTLPFNGHLYSLVVRGALSDAAQISATESYVNSKTGAY